MFRKCIKFSFTSLLFFLSVCNLSGQTTAGGKLVGSQKRAVTGTVVDERKSPLPGANIVGEGSNVATITDIDGKFSFNVPTGKEMKLTISFVGMKTRQVVLKDGQSELNIQLEPSAVAMKEVMVVGAYGTVQKRTDMVSSAYQVNAERIEALPAARIDNLLEGMVPGLKIDVNTDAASSTRSRLTTRIRGEGSMSASNEPLWIVDGTPIYTGDRTNMIPGMNTSVSPLTYINPDDIESLTVLKDATATSIYGANGANGVILVTTKKGRSGKMLVTLSQQNGVSMINQSTKFKVLNAEEYLMLARESYVNSGRDLKSFPFQDNELNSYSTTDTDWSKVYYDKGFANQTNLSLRGGTDAARYFVSGSYYKGNSTILGNTQERFSVRANLDIAMSKKMNFGFYTTTSYNLNDIFNPGDDYYRILPIYSPYNEDGNSFRLYNKTVSELDENGSPMWVKSKFFNSLAEREENDYTQRTLATNSNVVLDYQVLKGLEWTSQFGFDYQSGYEDQYSARSNWSGMSLTTGEPIGYSTRNNANFLLWTLVERLNYRQTFGWHTIGGLFGMEATSKENRSSSATGSGFVNDKVKEVSYAIDRSGSSSRGATRSLSYFLQGTYAYKSKYYLTLNARRDGVSGFGSDSKWKNNASVGVSWNMHNEDFFNNENIQVLKLKASFGSNGNSRIGTQEALGIYSYSSSNNYMNQPGATMSGSPNSKLTWETTYISNLGVRIELFQKKIQIEIEGYNKETVDLLSNLDVSRTTGDTRSYRNSGRMQNSGIELAVEALILDRKYFEWNLSLNASHNKNKLLELYNGIEKVMGNNIWREGYDINTLYLIRWAGVDPRDGSPLWYDARGNLTRSYSANNRVAWKTSAPLLTGGFTNSFESHSVSLQTLFTYTIGGYAFSTFGRGVSSDGLNIGADNQSVNQLDRWQKPGDVALSPKPIWNTSTGSVMNSTRHVYKTTHIRLKNISLSYKFQEELIKPLGLSTLNVFMIADNIGVWTPYDKSSRNSYRQSMSGYPMESTVSVGCNLSF